MFAKLDPRPLLIILAFVLAACAGATSLSGNEATGKLHVVATTTLVGDVVRAVGGDAIALTVLLPPGAEPHGYLPSPQDLTKLAQADVVFVNGLGLEEALMPTLASAVADEKIVPVSDGIEVLELDEDNAEEQHDHGLDPHTWTDPNNVIVWTHNIAVTLAAADTAHSADYLSRAEAYKQELADLDAWIREQVAQIPDGNRALVTDHAVFGYFARRYGFEQLGTILPGFSALAEPSARELGSLEDVIRALGVKAIFVGNTANPGLAERVASDTTTRLLFVYSDSLSDANGPASTYLDFMRHNVSIFVDGLE